MENESLTSKLSVEVVTPDQPNDNTIVDAARISFDKRASLYTEEQNNRLRKYLFNPRGGPPHWGPFGMPRFTILVSRSDIDLTQFFLTQSLAGFSWHEVGDHVAFNGSLWAWYQSLEFLYANGHFKLAFLVISTISVKFPHFYSFAIKDNKELKINFGDAELDLNDHLDHSYDGFISDKTHYETLRIRAPIFVARQLIKHQVHLLWNEVSRRYVKDVPELFFPEEFHQAPEKNVKQGSSSDVFDDVEMIGAARQQCLMSLDLYESLINESGEETMAGLKMAPEEARMFLPQNMMTTWYWTGSLNAFNRVLKERLWKGAQKTGTQEVSFKIRDALTDKLGDLVFQGYD